MPAKPNHLSQANKTLLQQLGERLRSARLRRSMSAAAVAEAAKITRATLDRAERGDAAVTAGTYLKVLTALGLEATLDAVGVDQLEDEREVLPARRVGTSAPRRIFLKRYEQLKQLAWSRGGLGDRASIGPTEALHLYERNWKHIDIASMSEDERCLVKKLESTVGKGVLLV